LVISTNLHYQIVTFDPNKVKCASPC